MKFDTSVLQVAVEDIIPNRFQPRLSFEDTSLKELSESIKQHGIIQPLVLRKNGEKYEIIAGERRYKAATMAGLSSVPAVIAKIDDKTSAEVAIVENVQRRELSAIEEAKSYQALLDQGYMSKEQLAQKMGVPFNALENKLKLLNLSNEVQNAILENQISERHGRALLAITNHELQVQWLNRIINERLTVRQLDELIKKEGLGDTVNISSDINAIKQNSSDITPNGLGSPSIENNVMNMQTIDLGESTTSNGFFNSLENQAANMQMTETTIFGDAMLQPVISNNPVETSSSSAQEIDTLDMLDFVPVKPTIDMSLAKQKIDNLVLDLKNNKYTVEIAEKIDNNQTVYTIVIKNTEN